MRDSQVPIAMSAFGDKVTKAAWRTKPATFVVATQDGAIEPSLQIKTARRIGARAVEVKGSHVVFLSQPAAVAKVIEDAAARAGSGER